MEYLKITSLAILKNSGWKSKSIKDELRDNLIRYKKEKKDIFTDIHGYEETVIPDLERAILSKHDINFLGLRGQAKTKIARELVELLDEYIPIVKGSVLNEDPFNPITHYAKELIKEEGDNTPISWMHRSERYSEKLATPDVTVPDLIGDVDPIKAANLKLSFSDFEVINYGLIPRSNRCIFVINEIPDLQPRIQVFVFTANPEDYTNRGNIVTPLKDRIGSQILTHYPKNIEISKVITKQENKVNKDISDRIHVPELAKNLIEQLAFEARSYEYVDSKSGVSARLTTAAYEYMLSSAERRMYLNNELETAIRISDFLSIVPAVNGKLELVYEGEQEGSYIVVLNLISKTIKTIFNDTFPVVNLKSKDKKRHNPYKIIQDWFEKNKIKLKNDLSNGDYQNALHEVKGLNEFVKNKLPSIESKEINFYMEFLLHGIAENSLISKKYTNTSIDFKDLISDIFSGEKELK
jgi:magnesium chelatase subunit I